MADAERAARDPHLAVLSVMAHGRDDDIPTAVAVALAATSAAAALPEPLRTLCYALIESSLGDAARKTFAMLPQGQKFFSENQRRWFAEGEARGEARAILRILERRSLAVSPDQRERIFACTETAKLEGWLDRALVAESTEELFVGGGP